MSVRKSGNPANMSFESIKDFNPDASIQYWFDVVARRPGGSKTMENIKHAKEAVTVIEASTSQEVEDGVEMVQEMGAVEDIEYDLVEDAEEDSDYKSDLDSDKLLCEASTIRTQLTKCPKQTWPTWLQSVSKLPKQYNIFHFCNGFKFRDYFHIRKTRG